MCYFQHCWQYHQSRIMFPRDSQCWEIQDTRKHRKTVKLNLYLIGFIIRRIGDHACPVWPHNASPAPKLVCMFAIWAKDSEKFGQIRDMKVSTESWKHATHVWSTQYNPSTQWMSKRIAVNNAKLTEKIAVNHIILVN